MRAASGGDHPGWGTHLPLQAKPKQPNSHQVQIDKSTLLRLHEMLGTKYTVYKLESHTLLLGLSDVFDVFSDIFVNIFICRSIRLRSVYIGAAWIPAIKLALFTFISLQRFTPMPTRIGNSFSKSKNIFFGQNSWRTGRTCWLSSARGGRVTP